MSADNTIKEYRDFIARKSLVAKAVGFAPASLPDRLFKHQRAGVDFALGIGRAAIWYDTGLGKSGVEAVFADLASKETRKPALILTPLAVAQQMRRECAAFGIDARVVRDASEVGPGVNIANYERLGRLDPTVFGAVGLDESSILKSFMGATKRALVDAFRETPYRLAATATPAPNDHMELGTHSEFLGIMGSMEMLCRWFINDTSTASQEWRLKGHAVKDFWAWVASWARAASLPSDLGGEDTGYILPPVQTHLHIVKTDLGIDAGENLFRIPDQSATAIHKEKRLTMADRISMSASIANAHDGYAIVWCERDDESEALAAAIPDAVEIKGSMPLDAKEQALDDFATGKRRVMVTKPRIAGFGLNLQHVDCQVFSSLSHSYEAYYQAIRRSWRFGQTRTVHAHIVLAETERPIWKNVQRKAADHERMKRAMAQAMAGAQTVSNRKAYIRPEAVTLPAFLKGAKE